MPEPGRPTSHDSASYTTAGRHSGPPIHHRLSRGKFNFVKRFWIFVENIARDCENAVATQLGLRVFSNFQKKIS
jgi:hypothetical protein